MKINEVIKTKTSHGIILKNCSQFLKDSNFHPLWRGGDEPENGFDDEIYGDDVYRIKHLKNRWPSESSIVSFNNEGINGNLLRKEIDVAMMQKYELGRANTLQFTGSKVEARGYSERSRAFLCFPIDGYEFLWSPNTHDYVAALIGVGFIIPNIIDKYPDADEKKIISTITKIFMKEVKYKSIDMAQAIKSEHEILIKGPWYLVDAYDPENFYKRLKNPNITTTPIKRLPSFERYNTKIMTFDDGSYIEHVSRTRSRSESEDSYEMKIKNTVILSFLIPLLNKEGKPQETSSLSKRSITWIDSDSSKYSKKYAPNMVKFAEKFKVKFSRRPWGQRSGTNDMGYLGIKV